ASREKSPAEGRGTRELVLERFPSRMPHADSDPNGEPMQQLASRSAQAGSAFDPGSGVLTRGLDRGVFDDLRSRAGVDETVAFVHGYGVLGVHGRFPRSWIVRCTFLYIVASQK